MRKIDEMALQKWALANQLNIFPYQTTISCANDHENEGETFTPCPFIHWVSIWGVWVVAGMFVVGFGVMAWHHLMPTNLCWLSDQQANTPTTFLFSQAVTSVGFKYIGTRMN
jgi:hypothetical protein